MVQLDQQYPQYGFAQHKGYGVPAHLAALQQHGPCPEHRRSFEPVKSMTGKQMGPRACGENSRMHEHGMETKGGQAVMLVLSLQAARLLVQLRTFQRQKHHGT
jgi:hypothetical protein